LPSTWFTVMLFTSQFEFFNTSGIKIYAAIGHDDMTNLKIFQFKLGSSGSCVLLS
jgi:hypothetical protein